jgi:hypothetical protein
MSGIAAATSSPLLCEDIEDRPAAERLAERIGDALATPSSLPAAPSTPPPASA